MDENLPGRARSLKRLFVVLLSVTVGIVAATTLLIVAYSWYENRPTDAKQWKPADLSPTGIRVTLKSRLLDRGIHYLFEVEPLDLSFTEAFDKAVRKDFPSDQRDTPGFIPDNPPQTPSFHVHFLDSSGLELCKLDIGDFSVREDSDGRAVSLASFGTSYSCSPNDYRHAMDWTVTWNFPRLESAKAHNPNETVAPPRVAHKQGTQVFVEEWRTIGSAWLPQRKEDPSEARAALGGSCKAFVLTDNKERADYSIRFDRSLGGDGLGPSNKPHSYRYSLFNQTGDKLIAESTDSLEDVVDRACKALTYQEAKKVGK